MLAQDLGRADGCSVMCADSVGHEPDFRGTFGSAWAEEWSVTLQGLD